MTGPSQVDMRTEIEAARLATPDWRSTPRYASINTSISQEMEDDTLGIGLGKPDRPRLARFTAS